MIDREKTVHNSWSEELQALRDELKQTSEKLFALKNINYKEYNGISTIRTAINGSLNISFYATRDELETAPPQVKKLMGDLGLVADDSVFIEVGLHSVDSLNEFYKEFHFTIRPFERTPEKIGIDLSSAGHARITAPTVRKYDGVHQKADYYFDRGAEVFRMFHSLKPVGKYPHPLLADILISAGAWFLDIVDNRNIEK